MPGDVALVFDGDCQGRRIVLGWRLLLYRFPSRQIGYVAILAQGSFDGGDRWVARAMVASIAKVASRAPESRAMLKASFPEGSRKPISAPAAIRSLQMTALLRAADSMRGVWPLESRALRLSPRWMWIWTALWTP